MSGGNSAWRGKASPRRVKSMKRQLRVAWTMVALTMLTACTSIGGTIEPSERRTRERATPAGRAIKRRPPVQREERVSPTPGPAAQAAPGAAATPPTANSRLEVLSTVGGSKVIEMEFYGLDIDHLLRLLSYAAQVTIVKSEQVTGPITVIAPEPVPLEVAFQVLDSVLAVRGFTMVKTPLGIYKVVPVAEAMQSGVPVQFGGVLPEGTAGDGLITQVIPLQNLSANDLANQLQGLLSPNALVTPTSTNSLIITDTAASIERALEIINDAEQQLSGGLKVFSLQYYDATEMSDLVTSIVLSRGGAGAVGPRPTWERRVVGRTQPGRPTPRPGQPAQPQAAGGMGSAGPEFAYPDTRTNSLIVLATPLHLGQIRDLITQLDRPVSLRDSYFIYPVQNLVASDLAELVAPLIGAQVTTTTATRQRTTTPTARSSQTGGGAYGRQGTGAQTGSTLRQMSAPQGNSSGRPLGARGLEVEPLAGESNTPNASQYLLMAQNPEGVAPVAPQPEAPSVVQPGFVEEATSVTGAGVAEATIVADDNTNTLLISAPPEQIDLLQQMLEKLDVLPPQVHIRAIIAEVTLSRDTSLGFQFQSLRRTWGTFGGEKFAGDVGSGFGLVKPGDKTAPSGFFGTISGSEFEAVLNALTTDSKARILSAPSIFTTNNQPATIDVSQQLPFPTGTFQTTTDVGTISTSIGYKSVGIVLDVTPRVTQGDIVQIEVQVSANEPGSEVQVANLSYPTFNQRLAQATINVKAGDTVVLGGLMRESITRTANRVPLLGDLPVIGALFRSTTSKRLKSELLVFLTPQVVRTSEEVEAVTDSEKSRLPEVPRSLQRKAKKPAPVYAPPAMEEPEEMGEPEAEAPVMEEAPVAAPESEAPVVEAPAPTPTPEEPPAQPNTQPSTQPAEEKPAEGPPQ